MARIYACLLRRYSMMAWLEVLLAHQSASRRNVASWWGVLEGCWIISLRGGWLHRAVIAGCELPGGVRPSSELWGDCLLNIAGGERALEAANSSEALVRVLEYGPLYTLTNQDAQLVGTA